MSDPSPAPNRGNRRLIVVICVIIAAWIVVLTFRRPLQARYLALWAEQMSDPRLRAEYILRIARFDLDGLGALSLLMARDDSELRRLVVMALATRPRSKEVYAMLQRVLDDPDRSVRAAAAIALGHQNWPYAIEPLHKLAADPQEPNAPEAVAALAAIAHPDAEKSLIELARTADSLPVRACAIRYLGLMRAKSAIHALIDLLAEERPVEIEFPHDRVLRSLTPADLGKLKIRVVPQAGPTLTTIADLAEDALRRITGQAFGFSTSQPADRKKTIIDMWRKWAAGPHVSRSALQRFDLSPVGPSDSICDSAKTIAATAEASTTLTTVPVFTDHLHRLGRGFHAEGADTLQELVRRESGNRLYGVLENHHQLALH